MEQMKIPFKKFKAGSDIELFNRISTGTPKVEYLTIHEILMMKLILIKNSFKPTKIYLGDTIKETEDGRLTLVRKRS